MHTYSQQSAHSSTNATLAERFMLRCAPAWQARPRWVAQAFIAVCEHLSQQHIVHACTIAGLDGLPGRVNA